MFTTLFSLEMLLRMLAQGVVLHKGSYLRDPWNLLDFVIVIFGLLDIAVTIIVGNANLAFLSTFRMLRLLRPLRAITSFPSMRLIVASVLKSIPMLLNALILFLVFILFFGIVGVQLFKGTTTRTCFNSETDEIIDEAGYICGHAWGARVCPDGYECSYRESGTSPYGYGYIHFDNILNAMLVMFQFSTEEEWTATAANFIDANGYFVVIYFVLAVMFSSLFFVNLVVAILTDFFDHNVQEERKSQSSMSRRRRNLQENNSTLQRIKTQVNKVYDFLFDHPAYKKNRLLQYFSSFQKRVVRRIVLNNAFSTVFIILVVLNTASMTIDHYGMPVWLDEVTDWLNIMFIGLFIAELVLKLFGLGLREFLSDTFNIFDSVVVMFSFIELFFQHESGFTALRTIRLLRVFKLARFFTSLKRLLEVIFKSMWSVGSLMVLLLLVLFMYSLIGMQLFGGTFDFPEEGIPETNYDTLYWGMITSFIVVVSDDWTHILFDSMRAVNGPGPVIGALFMSSLFVVGNYIVLNLFIAVLMSQFGDVEEEKPEDEILPLLKTIGYKLLHVIRRGKMCSLAAGACSPVTTTSFNRVRRTASTKERMATV